MNRDCPPADQLRRLLSVGPSATISDAVAAIGAHVNQCPDCQRELERITAADWDDLAGETRPDQSSGALRRMMDQFVERAPGPGAKPAGDEETRFPGPPDQRAPLGRLQQYRIESRMAEGAQGILFRAWDEQLKRTVAIKVLRQAASVSMALRARFEREARAAAALNDERIVRVYQIGSVVDFPPFIVMEFVPGQTLRQQLESGRPGVRDAAGWIRDAALGLTAAHAAGLVHRDVKPSNLLLDERTGLVRLTDFGLALDESDAIRMTQDGFLAGTPAYMSPEQLHWPEAVDFRTDLYSLGVVFYELLTGEVPFRGTMRMTLLQVAHDEPRPPRQFNDEIPRDLETICLKAMARDPAARFESGRAMAAELDRWLAGQPILSRPAGRLERLGRWCARRPLVALLGATSAILLATLGVVLVQANRRLASAARIADQHARAANSQRDSALETLRQLVFQLQDGFDQEVVDLDHLQRDALQIAIDGLARLRRQADEGQAPGLETAEAFRRMGDILSRLDEPADARDCFVRAEAGFRAALEGTEQRKARAGLIETLWSRHDLEIDEEAGGLVGEILSTATREARELDREWAAPESRLLLGRALMYHARELVDREGGQTVRDQAGELLQESRSTLEPLLDATSGDAGLVWEVWLEATGLLASLAETDADTSAAIGLLDEAVSRSSKLAETAGRSEGALQQLLALHHRLRKLLLAEKDTARAAEVFAGIARQLEGFRISAGSSAAAFTVAMEFHDGLRDQLIADADWEGLDFFEHERLKVIEARILEIPADEQAQIARAECGLELADAASLLDQPVSRVRAAYRESVDQYRELSGRGGFEETHWAGFLNALLTAAEFELDVEGNELDELLQEARSVRERIASMFPHAVEEWLPEEDQRINDLLRGVMD